MIAKLRGRLDSISEDGVVVDVNGVGYFVHGSARLRDRLPGVGESVSLLIDTQVREDSITLYGFFEAAEREWFRLLQTVQGVGARLALGIVGTLGVSELARAVAVQDRAALARANGVGPRLAARIVNELKERAPAMSLTVAAATTVPDGVVAPSGGPAQDAVSALVNLGYRPVDAASAIGAVQQRLGPETPLAELIRGGLKELTQ